jgi:predicted XRE-type DNA-binding protein
MTREIKDSTRTIKTATDEPITYTESSGNVFADLGIDEPEEHLAKAQLVSRIAELIAEREVTQVRAAQILGVPQPKVSALLRGDFTGFSLERLFRLLIALDNDVSIVVAPKRAEQGHLSVVALQ